MQTCLVIDESPVVRKIASRILSMGGYAPETAGTLEEAEAVLSRLTRLDLAIVSASLPGEPADGVIRALNAHPKAAGAAFLVSLVEAHLGLMTRAKRAGASGFTYRPFDRSLLLEWLAPYASLSARSA